MKILVIGDGALGSAIARQAKEFGHELFQTSRKNPDLIHLDLLNEQEFTFLPDTDWAVFTAGISGYKECAGDHESRLVNVERTIELCSTLLKRGTKILFPSSTAVFDGKMSFPTPETTPTPATEYGRQKAEVEKFLRQYPDQTAVVRLTKILDRDTPLIADWLRSLAAEKEITPFSDLTIAPVLFEDAAIACCRIMENGGSGICHCSGPQEISYLEFARNLCVQAGFDCKLISPTSCKGILDFCPEHCGLDSSSTEKFIQFKFPAADQVIKKLIQPRCLLCGRTTLHYFEEYTDFPGITSDCKPWLRSGEFTLCKECGHVQKKLSPQWYKDINKIYSGYEMYPLSAGSEPLIFDDKGKATPRSGILLDGLISTLALPDEGAILDVGCGNGSLLQQFNLRRPKWKLYGHEQSEQREEILHLPGVQGFYSGKLDSIERKFDLITMTYVIEHLTDPVAVLKQLVGLLHEDGQIVIHTSSFEDNPFDLMVCDHCSHFTPETLKFLAAEAGLQVTAKTDPWLAKEIGIAACKSTSQQPPVQIENNIKSIVSALNWLEQLTRKAKQAASRQEIGIFGTAVAGTWLAASLEETTFFVDEDPSKQSRTHMGRPIIGPENIPQNAAVVMGFNNDLGKRIARRLNDCYPQINFIIPDN
ncbi:sugar nucleotide-binding protein [Maridesulfovibrio sp.]|uniref:sugar nucleotide-binding protein n=1 Tax=Maridesulfovibrio sp. TaxID=2795000 RepID=UPI003BADA66B